MSDRSTLSPRSAFARCLPWLAGLALAALPLAPHAATLTVEAASPTGSEVRSPVQPHRLRLTGPIEPGDSERVGATLRKLKERSSRVGEQPLATVELAGKGGDLLEGIKIGYLFREFDVATVVRQGEVCLSACALIFLGGTATHGWPAPLPSRKIELGGQLGFHNFTLNAGALQNDARGAGDGIGRAFGLAREGAAQLMRYALDMGVDPGFFTTLMGQAPEVWNYIETAGQFLQIGATVLGPLPSPPSLQQQAANLCNHATGWRVGVKPAQARPVVMPQRRPLLQDNGANEAAALVLRGIGVPPRDEPATSGTSPTAHFEVAGPASDSFQMRCQVTLSTTDLDTFEVALMASGGLLRAYQAPPAGNPALFRYHKDDVLNRRR